MQLKNKNVYFLRAQQSKRLRSEEAQHQQADERDPLVLRLSRRAKDNLQILQLKFLDRKGRQPNASEVIERLINEAAGSEPDVPYPAR
jgi:hypothetical protein